MKHDISFQKVKLTNNNLDQHGHVSERVAARGFRGIWCSEAERSISHSNYGILCCLVPASPSAPAPLPSPPLPRLDSGRHPSKVSHSLGLKARKREKGGGGEIDVVGVVCRRHSSHRRKMPSVSPRLLLFSVDDFTFVFRKFEGFLHLF